MLRIGLTGGIGTGKTYISKIFEKYSVPIFNWDDIASNMIQYNINAISLVKDLYGDDLYINDTLNREKLASIIFEDKYSLNHFNNMLAPLVMDKIDTYCLFCDDPYIIIDCDLIYETEISHYFDEVIGIVTPLEIRIERLMKRSGMNRKEILHKMNYQMDDNEKLSMYNIMMSNGDRTNDDLKKTISTIHNYIMNKSKRSLVY